MKWNKTDAGWSLATGVDTHHAKILRCQSKIGTIWAYTGYRDTHCFRGWTWNLKTAKSICIEEIVSK